MNKVGRAVVYDKPNAPFVIKEYPVRDVKPREVLVKISMSTICRSDIHSYHGHRPNPCPGILGHEIIGVIEQLGDSVTHDMRGDVLTVGDRVTWTEYFADGDSYYRDIHDMPQKAPGLRKYGHDLVEDDPHFLGGFADYCYIQPGTGILKLPDEISDAEATPLNCGVSTMISVTEAANIQVGDTVVIQGLGLLGLYGCAIAKARGAGRVVALDPVRQRVDIAKRFGADIVIDVSKVKGDALVQAVRDVATPDGADVVIEVCGVASVVTEGIQMLRVGGRYILAGFVGPGATLSIDAHDLVKKWITLRGIHNYHPRHLIQALDFVMSNRDRYPFKEIVDSTFRLDELNDAFDKAANHQVLRAAVIP